MRYENNTAISHNLSKIKMLATVTLFLSIWVLAVSITIAVQAKPDGGLSVIDTMITVGENRLHFQIIEGESPTILLEAGGGMDLTEWADLAPKTCTRDRCDRSLLRQGRLIKTLDSSHDIPLRKSISSLLEDVDAWRGGGRLTDDVSILGVEIMEWPANRYSD